MLEHVLTLISKEMNSHLTMPPSNEEIMKFVFSFLLDIAPSLYGFSTLFYQHFWDLIKKDMFRMID